MLIGYLLCASASAHMHIKVPNTLAVGRPALTSSFFTSEHHTAAFAA
jgi:hypothetical protein